MLALLHASAAPGQTTLRATFGWGDSFRFGWWTPVYVSIMGPRVKPVILEVSGQKGLSSGVIIRQHAVLQPASQTFLILYPLDAPPSKVIVSILDETTGQTLAWQTLEDPIYLTNSGSPPHRLLGGGSTFIGVSTGAGTAAGLRAQWDAAQIAGGFLPPARLPMDSAGYQAVRVLMLDGMNLRDLTPSQERAILDWVVAGGNLLFRAGPDDLPQQDPILAALPCDIGSNARFSLKGSSPINGRILSPRAGAISLPIFSGQLTAYTFSAGLGQITVLPADISDLHWDNTSAARTAWKAILSRMVDLPDPVTPREVTDAEEDIPAGAHPRSQDAGGRETMALRKVIESMPSPASTHDWNGALLLLAALMFAAGPVDSMLLYRVGKPPRTWVTVIGWVGLIAAGSGLAVVSSHGARRQIQRFSLIDQVDHRTVSRCDILEITSQKAENFVLPLEPSEWWEPVRPLEHARDPYVDFICEQDHDGSRPRSVKLKPGQPTVLRGEKIAPRGALADVKLSLQNRSGTPRVTGMLKNESGAEFSGVRIVTNQGECRFTGIIHRGESIQIDQPLAPQRNGDGPSDALVDLTPERTDRINSMIQQGGFACVTAESSATSKAVGGADLDARVELLRLVVPISK